MSHHQRKAAKIFYIVFQQFVLPSSDTSTANPNLFMFQQGVIVWDRST